MFNNGYYQPMGYTAPNRPQPRFTQPVTNEMSKLVLANDDELSVKISQNEKIKNMCTHKYPGTGQIALVDGGKDAEGREQVTCRVCGETFHMIMEPDFEISKAVEKVVDILQSAKTLYLDIPEEFAKEYFQILTLLRRSPQVFTKGAKNFNQYDYSASAMGVYNGMNSFQHVNAMIGGANMGGINPGMYPPVWGQAPMGAPMAPQQPMQQQWVQQQPYGYPMAPVPGAPMDPNANPLMYSAPVSAPPVAPVVAPAPGVNPTAPATGEVAQVKEFSV